MLHDNKELFEQAVLRTSEAFGIEAGIVEKDYFVTLFLREIAKEEPTIIFSIFTPMPAHPYRIICHFLVSTRMIFPSFLFYFQGIFIQTKATDRRSPCRWR